MPLYSLYELALAGWDRALVKRKVRVFKASE
jgi:hypothetical protein